MTIINDQVITWATEHATAELPRESCGLVVSVRGAQEYWPCHNHADERDRFVIAPDDWARAEDAGDIVAIVHSHAYRPAWPSEVDRVGIERSGLPWLIVSVPTGAHAITHPCGYMAELVGRPFALGVLDCYSLIRDYYKLQLGIELPDFQRTDGWERRRENLYLKHFREAGFEINASMRPNVHDVLLMQIGAQDPNHGAVYLGDGRIMHHLRDHLSAAEPYCSTYQKCTTHILRHRNLA